MKNLLLSLVVVATGFWANSQVICAGISPANIVGNYVFEWADPAGGDWTTPDFLTQGVFVQDTLMIVDDGTAGVNPEGNPMSAEACSPLINDLTGKIAVIYRNTCEFGEKALNAQTAGAVGVIIINRDNEAVGMGGGTGGVSVTIPVVMITSLDGADLVAEMANGPVVMLLGNKVGVFVNDIGSTSSDILISPFAGAHSTMFDGFELAMQMYNFGSSTQASITVNAKITNPSAAVVYDETVIVPSMDTGDTTYIVTGNPEFFPPFTLATYPDGEYTLTYTLDLGATDESDFDNVFTSKFTVNPNVISLANIDASTGLPNSTSYPKNSTSEYQTCMFYVNPNAHLIGVEGVYFTPYSADLTVTPLAGEEININFYEWNDTWTDLSDPTFTANNDWFQNLNLLQFAQYYPTSDAENGTSVYAPLPSPVRLVDDQRYLICVQTFNSEIAFGYDNLDYDGNQAITVMPIAPVKVDDTWFTGGWVGSSASAIGLKASPDASINEVSSIDGKAYPNPATDVVTVSIEANGSAVLTVTDISGKVVLSQNVALSNGTADVNISSLEAGMYVFNVSFENGESSQFNVVKK